MKFRLTLVGVMASLLIVAVLAVAQDTAENTCDEQNTIDSLQEAITAIEPGETFRDNLNALQAVVSTAQLECADYVLSDSAEGRDSVVLGPYTFPSGIYRATLTTDDFAIVGGVELSGHCRLHFAVSAGDATKGAETIFEVEECRILIEVEASAAWELRFDKVQ